MEVLLKKEKLSSFFYSNYRRKDIISLSLNKLFY